MKKNLKQYPYDSTPIHNKRKWVGAFVWHGELIKRITGTNMFGNLILNRLIDVPYNSVRLVKINDVVKFNNLADLPDAYSEILSCKIIGFLGNGLINTDADPYKHGVDYTNYAHLIAFNPHQ